MSREFEETPYAEALGSDPAFGAMSAVAAVVRNAEGIRRRFAQDGGVGVSEVRALFRILEGGSLTPRDLAESLDLNSGSVTALIDRLEADALVHRVAHPSDRRMLVVELTPAGRTMTGRWMSTYADIVRRSLDGVQPEEVDVIVGFLRRVETGMRAAEL
ncbi:MAG: MarR family transcriptional regulator [Naasia sp.]